MKKEWQDALNAMRDEGYCVIVWTPEELGDVDPGHVEDVCIERGNNMIESLKSENENQ